MFWFTSPGFDLGVSHELDEGLLPVMRFSTDGWNIESVRGLHVRSVIEAADESIHGNVHSAFDVAVATQRKIRQPTVVARCHAKLHCRARRCHWQIECVLEFYFLCLRQTE